MDEEHSKYKRNRFKYIVFAILAFCVILSLFFLSHWWVWHYMYGGHTVDDHTFAGQLGDSFGAVNALFSGFAFALLIITLMMQHEELGMQRDELRRQVEEMEETKEVMRQQAGTMLLSSSLNSINSLLSDLYKKLEIEPDNGLLLCNIRKMRLELQKIYNEGKIIENLQHPKYLLAVSINDVATDWYVEFRKNVEAICQLIQFYKNSMTINPSNITKRRIDFHITKIATLLLELKPSNDDMSNLSSRILSMYSLIEETGELFSSAYLSDIDELFRDLQQRLHEAITPSSIVERLVLTEEIRVKSECSSQNRIE